MSTFALYFVLKLNATRCVLVLTGVCFAIFGLFSIDETKVAAAICCIIALLLFTLVGAIPSTEEAMKLWAN